MGYLIVARGGLRDGIVIPAKELPDVGMNLWWPRGRVPQDGLVPHGPGDGPYRVTGEVETLEDGRPAHVVRFDAQP